MRDAWEKVRPLAITIAVILALVVVAILILAVPAFLSNEVPETSDRIALATFFIEAPRSC